MSGWRADGRPCNTAAVSEDIGGRARRTCPARSRAAPVGHDVPGAVAAAAVGRWAAQPRVPDGPAEEITFEQLHDGAEVVRIKGMAHYASTITQTVPGGLFGEDTTYYLRVLSRARDDGGCDPAAGAHAAQAGTSRPSGHDGRGRPGPSDVRVVPPSTEAMLSKRTDYWFADEVLLLQARRIASEDVWTAPARAAVGGLPAPQPLGRMLVPA